MTQFKREERYVVLKIKDLEKLPPQAYSAVKEVVDLINPFLPERCYAVIENDWPEYEVIWKMIEDRVGKEGGANAGTS